MWVRFPLTRGSCKSSAPFCFHLNMIFHWLVSNRGGHKSHKLEYFSYQQCGVITNMQHILYWQWCSDDLRRQQLASLSSTGLREWQRDRWETRILSFFIWRRFVLVPGSVRSYLRYDRPSRNSFRNHSFHNCRNCHAKHKRHANEIAPIVHSGLHTITITTTRTREQIFWRGITLTGCHFQINGL